MTAFIASFMFVVLAEMGDKTQLLAMAFAARYSAHKVLLAVFLATLINHALAVAAGNLLTVFIPLEIISFLAACSFVIFGLWTIRGDRLEEDDKRQGRFGPLITVGVAFFLAEMGDKTQLATISLAVQYRSVFNVLLGTTLGMVAADAAGIIIGIVMRKHLPEEAIKNISAAIFILFGLSAMHKILSARLSPAYAWAIVLFTGACAIYAARRIRRSRKNADTH